MNKIRIFNAFLKKEIFHILRDPRTLMILFGMPILLVFIFGFAVTNEFKNASIAVLDKSKDDLSKALIEQLAASKHFNLVESFEYSEDLKKAFRKNEIKLAIVIPAQFEKQFYKESALKIQLITDASDPNLATTLTNYTTGIIQRFQKERSQKIGISNQIEVKSRMLFNPKLKAAYNFIPGVVALILMLISAMMTSLTIAKEKESGTMDLLLLSPLSPLLIILGKVAPYFLLSFINAIIVFGLGYWLFEVPILGNIFLLIGLSLLYLLVTLSLGILISTISKTQQTAMMISLFVLMMPTVILSGFLFPIASMPFILQKVSNIIPAKYFIIIEQAIMLKGAGIEAVFQPAAVLFLMMMIFILVALKNFKVIYK